MQAETKAPSVQPTNYTMEVDSEGNIVLLPAGNKCPTYTLIFIHGFDMRPSMMVQYFVEDPLRSVLRDFRLVFPVAPIRYVSHFKKTTHSWFDIRTYENSFTRPFDEAFNES